MEPFEALEIFNHPDLLKVRRLEIDGKPWFVGKDVAEALGYGNGNNKSKALANAIARHVDERYKKKLPYSVLKTLGDLKNLSHYGAIFINEPGLYSLILGSNLPSAKKFEKWVFEEVLPAIRKYGGYFTDEKLEEILNDPDTLIRFVIDLKQKRGYPEPTKEKEKQIDSLLEDLDLVIHFAEKKKQRQLQSNQVKFLRSPE